MVFCYPGLCLQFDLRCIMAPGPCFSHRQDTSFPRFCFINCVFTQMPPPQRCLPLFNNLSKLAYTILLPCCVFFIVLNTILIFCHIFLPSYFIRMQVPQCQDFFFFVIFTGVFSASSTVEAIWYSGKYLIQWVFT